MTTETLEYVRLGMTELSVSPIAFGTWELGGAWGSFDEEKGIEAIRNARELGVNLFDTAQGYGFGASERLLGRALRDDLDNRRETFAELHRIMRGDRFLRKQGHLRAEPRVTQGKLQPDRAGPDDRE